MIYDSYGLALILRHEHYDTWENTHCSKENRTEEGHKEERFLLERLELYKEIMARPCVMGADLVKAGLRPGPAFSEVLAFAHDLHLCGVEKEKALPQVLAYARERGITVQK